MGNNDDIGWECQNNACKIKCKDKLVCEGQCTNPLRVNQLKSDKTVYNLHCQTEFNCNVLSPSYFSCIQGPFTCDANKATTKRATQEDTEATKKKSDTTTKNTEATKDPGITKDPGTTKHPGTIKDPGTTKEPGTTKDPGTTKKNDRTRSNDATTEKSGSCDLRNYLFKYLVIIKSIYSVLSYSGLKHH